MVQIAKIEISNFRGIRDLTWLPKPGVNCLVGTGDSGKSTLLQAIDWCIGARRTLPLSDADFHAANVHQQISITVTLGCLDDRMRRLDSYGLYVRGFNPCTGAIEDEPDSDLEDVLSVRLTVADDLNPTWTLVSDRATAQGASRHLAWHDRLRIAPVWIGSFSARNLSWRAGSVLASISEEQSSTSGALAEAARRARRDFGTVAAKDFTEALSAVRDVATQLGVAGATDATAMLDASSVSPTDGAISLHDQSGIPLRNLGLGSARLLVAGLQGRATSESAVVLVDEVEHGLEPHRIARFLVTLGSKSAAPQTQVFLTTHSPVVLRELDAGQIHVIRAGDTHTLLWAGDGMQGFQRALRRCAEAFLGSKVLVCEGVTEVGLVRGIDLFRDSNKLPTLMAAGGVLVDADGLDNIYRIAESFVRLGYCTAVLRDDDKPPDPKAEADFRSQGGQVFHWSEGLALEDELFSSVPHATAVDLYRFAVHVHGQGRVLDHLRTAKNGPVDPEELLADRSNLAPTLAKASKLGGWFKRTSTMEEAARSLVGPALSPNSGRLQTTLSDIFEWGIPHGS